MNKFAGHLGAALSGAAVFAIQHDSKKVPMKKTCGLVCIVALAALGFACAESRAEDVDSVRPVVVKTVPEAGAKNVAAGEVEIKITFSKEMMDGSWSWSTAWENSTPEGLEKPHYDSDSKTCIMKVKLEPGKTYGWWINSERFGNFKDKQGRRAVPYLFVFKVKG
jgi:hypothetical protein